MQFIDLIFYVLIALVGFGIGRLGHIYWGHINFFHHWIYGAILIIIGLCNYNSLGFVLFSLGLGHFISDFKDFSRLEFYGADGDGEKRFWDID